ncbi:fanconi-associated nuclease 1-like isoform X2 [Sinocyclocheilus rhinocerous]|uniref:Fanconi-associated nuclease n=1 Tax=Sinocyclocheilus rhinocerous TaxID=307959 RepID=A0A673HLC6_9TELE|nr:PREDICTED: fanconi-associated nuclease 1-like isoform X1 [Sinocyclocheilus rhinocerous]XP_016400730.1 PREDICTED: fanconi-associated nuclease 1-like isoform X2 [Sinocyclocheilus rhinocerous]
MESQTGKGSSSNRGSSRRLSVTKKKSQKVSAIKERTSSGGGVASITSFFRNTPPCKLACPLCGKLVPRYKINEHIDSQCQKFLGEDHEDALAVSDYKQEKITKTPSNGASRNDGKEKSPGEKDADTSPYFKKNCVMRQESSETNLQAKPVKTVGLGSLSSKLFRRALRLSGESEMDHAHVSGKEDTHDAELSSSQKENCMKSLIFESKAGSMDTDNTFPTEPAASNQPQVKNMEKSVAVLAESSSSADIQSVKSSSSSRVLKRKSEELPKNDTNTTETSVIHKKSRYFQSKTENRHETNGKSDQTEASSDIVPLSESQIKSKTTNKDIERKPDTTPANESKVRGVEEVSEGSEHQHNRLPYYLQNFRTVLEAVLENEDDRMLFNEEDFSTIHTFQQLSVPGQMLYVRLFQRKLKWLQVSKLEYTEISSDLKPVIQELVACGFLQTESELHDIQEVLDLLPAPELRNLAKTFHLGRGGNGTQKQQLVEGLLQLGKQRSLFVGQNNTAAVILKRAKQAAGSCVRLCRRSRAVFSRVLLLFSLTDTLEEEEMAAGGQGQLYTILLVNSGRLAFPEYTVNRSTRLFEDRDDLIRYETAMRALQEVIAAMQTGSWEDAHVLYATAKATWQEMKDSCDLSHQEQLPVFLRCFTVGWTYTRILSRGVEILQRLRRYEDAVEELRNLLSQSVYCVDSRGRWWDRLALNLQQHLKKHEQAICAIRDGLNDPLVRTGHKLSLHQRASRMKESASLKKYRLLLRDLPTVHVQDVTHVTLRGQLFPHEGGMGKSVFLRAANEDEGSTEGRGTMVMCSVEELALEHYRTLGFDQGIHGEGSTFSTLFGLLMWDIIFIDGVPDVFRNPYQTCPLDLHTDCFYGNRRETIEARAEMLREASAETLQELLADVWNAQEGRVCVLINWERFSSLQQAQSLVACLGGHFLSGVVLRMATDYRHCRGGLPDLVVWSTSNKKYKLVEVKGPNDRLSQKQQIWLDELHKLGADVEVCHVTAIGARGAQRE